MTCRIKGNFRVQINVTHVLQHVELNTNQIYCIEKFSGEGKMLLLIFVIT